MVKRVEMMVTVGEMMVIVGKIMVIHGEMMVIVGEMMVIHGGMMVIVGQMMVIVVGHQERGTPIRWGPGDYLAQVWRVVHHPSVVVPAHIAHLNFYIVYNCTSYTAHLMFHILYCTSIQ